MWILLDRQTVRLIPFAPCAVVRTTAMTLADLRSHQQASNMVCDKCETKLGKLVVPDKVRLVHIVPPDEGMHWD